MSGHSLRRTLAALRGAEVDARLDEALAALGDEDWRVRHEASLALARGATRARVVEALLDRVVGEHDLTRAAALASLGLVGAAATRAVLDRLARAQGPARRFLVEALREGDLGPAVEPLRALVDDADLGVAAAALETLALAKGPEVDAAIARALEHGDAVIRAAALCALERRPESVPVERVAALIDDADCARAAVRALAVATDPAAAELLVARLADPRPTIVSEALRGLVEGVRRRPTLSSAGVERVSLPPFISRETARHVAALAASGDAPQTRAAALALLGRIGDPATLPAILRGCEDADNLVASAAHAALDGLTLDAAALGEAASVGDRALRAALMTLRARGLGYDATRVGAALEEMVAARRQAPLAAEVLATRGGDLGRVMELLGDVLARGDDGAAAWLPAFEALCASSPEARTSLIARVRANEVGVAAAAALASWGVPADPEVLRVGASSADPRVRRLAVRAARGAGDLAAVRASLEDPDEGVRAEAADAWCARAADGDALLAMAEDRATPRPIRRRAVELMAFRAPSSPGALRAMLADGDVEVARAALGALGARVGVDALEALVAQGDPTLAAEALATLREVDVPRAGALALALLDHPAWSLRWEAARSLDGGDPVARAALLDRLDGETDASVRDAISERLGVEPVAG